ncbi:hypothetical protein ACLKA6_003368 [Drosophila palustris]
MVFGCKWSALYCSGTCNSNSNSNRSSPVSGLPCPQIEMQWHLRGAVTKLVACHPAITWLHFCIYSEPKLQQKPNNLAQVTAGSRRPYKLSQDNDEEDEEEKEKEEEEEVDAGSFQGNAKL